MAGRNLFATDRPVGAGQLAKRKGRNLFAEGVPSVVPPETPEAPPEPSLKILQPTAAPTERPTSFKPSGEALTVTQRREEAPTLAGAAEAIVGAPAAVGRAVGLEEVLDPISRAAARATVPEELKGAIPEPSTGELVGAGLQVGALLIPYGQLQTALTKGFGKLTSAAVAKALGAATTGATGGFALEAGEKIQRGEAPTPGITTAVAAALPVAPQVAGAIIKKAGKTLATVLGMSTGTGSEAIKQAFRGGKGFKAGLQGKLIADDVLDSATDALYDLRTNRGLAYQRQLKEIERLEGVIIDQTSINKKLNSLMKSFRIKRKIGAETGKVTVDMSRTKIDRSARTAMTELIEDVANWDDWTPIGADTLKQRIDDFYAPTKNSRAFSTALRNEVKKEIVKKVPQYNKLTKDYARATLDIDVVQKNLLAGKQDTAIRRLNTVFRDVNEYRLGVIDKLDAAAGTNLREQLAGIALSKKLPRGYLAKILPAGAAGVAGILNPLAGITIVAATSPRLVGSSAFRAGQLARGVGAVPSIKSGITARTGIEAGRRAGNGNIEQEEAQR